MTYFQIFMSPQIPPISDPITFLLLDLSSQIVKLFF